MNPTERKYMTKLKIEGTFHVDVELPLYRIGLYHAYCVFSEDRAIQVHWGVYPSVSLVSHSIAFGKKEEDCTREVFMEKYLETLKMITGTLPEQEGEG